MIILLLSLFWFGVKVYIAWLLLFGWWLPPLLWRLTDWMNRPREIPQTPEQRRYWAEQERRQKAIWDKMGPTAQF